MFVELFFFLVSLFTARDFFLSRRREFPLLAWTLIFNTVPTAMTEIHDQFDTILILDFGSQYSHLITRRCREQSVYAELMPCTQKIRDLGWKPKGVILSGSPYSVYDNDSPHVDPDVFELGVPILGICYGLQVRG